MRAGLPLLVLLVAAPIQAQTATGGVDPRVFPLTPHGGGISFPGATPAPESHLRLSAAPELGVGMLPVPGEDGTVQLIDWRADYAILVEWQIARTLALGLRLPRVQFQAAEAGSLEALDHPDPLREGGFGDLALSARWSLLEAGSLRLAAVGEVWIPTGDAEAFMGTGGVSLAPALIAEAPAGPLTLRATAGYRWRATEGRLLDLRAGDQLTFGLGAGLPLGRPLPRGSRLEGELRLETPAEAPFAGEAGPLPTAAEGLLALRMPLPGQVFVTAGVGRGLSARPGLGREAFRTFLTLGWEGPLAPTPPPASDGDHRGNPGRSAPPPLEITTTPAGDTGFFLGEAYRYDRMPMLPRALHSAVAIPLNMRWWTPRDWGRFALFFGGPLVLMAPLDPSLDVRLDQWITDELAGLPDIWGVGMQTVLWTGLAVGGAGTWAWASWTGQDYVAQGLSLMTEALAVTQLYHLGAKMLIGREGPTDGAGQGEVLGPVAALRLYPAGTPGGHAGTLYSLLSAGLAYFAPPWWVQAALHTVVGAGIALHVTSHRHFLSDALWGAAMGWYVGQWVVEHRRVGGPPHGERGLGIAVRPYTLDGGGGLMVNGRF